MRKSLCIALALLAPIMSVEASVTLSSAGSDQASSISKAEIDRMRYQVASSSDKTRFNFDVSVYKMSGTDLGERFFHAELSTLNKQMAEHNSVIKTPYIESSSTNGSSKVGVYDSGSKISITPVIIDDNRVMINYNVRLPISPLALEPVEAGGNYIEVPSIRTIGLTQGVAVPMDALKGGGFEITYSTAGSFKGTGKPGIYNNFLESNSDDTPRVVMIISVKTNK